MRNHFLHAFFQIRHGSSHSSETPPQAVYGSGFQIRDIETAFPVCFCNVDDLQMHAGKDRHIRNNRDAESVALSRQWSGLHQSQRCSPAVCRRQQLIDHGAQAASPGKQDLRIIQSLGKPDFCPVRKRMIRRNDDHELLPGDRIKSIRGSWSILEQNVKSYF